MISRAAGSLARLGLPTLFQRLFVLSTGIDMNAPEKQLGEYPTIDALFTRRLKAGLRPIQAAWVHPCDGQLDGPTAGSCTIRFFR